MHADSHFAIGKTHTVCQDYAICGDDEAPWAVVADGCSSSPHTDVGARLLALAASVYLVEGFWVPRLIAAEAAETVERTPMIQIEALDATLLAARVWGDTATAYVTGDGIVVGRRQDGTLDAWLVEYRMNAPFYLSYRIPGAQARCGRYVALTEGDDEGQGRRTVTRYTRDTEGNWTEHTPTADPGLDPFTLDLPTSTYDLVLLISDGAQSFQRRSGTAFEAVPLTEVIDQIAAVKGTAGEFVTRRLRSFLTRFCPKHEWHHNDDLAVAGITLGETP